jgi:hypothetical protein
MARAGNETGGRIDAAAQENKLRCRDSGEYSSPGGDGAKWLN